MAAVNPFDQFDSPATAASAALANPFDQFDTTVEPASRALEPFPEFVTPDDILPNVPATDTGPGAVSRGFTSGLLKQNPELLAETMEGLSLLGPKEFRETFIEGATSLRALAELSPKEFEPRAQGLFDSGSLDEVMTALGETFGQGLASTVPSLITGTVGGLAGARVAGKPGGIVGALVGATIPAAGLNYGEVYKALKEEGVTAEESAGFAAIAVGPMTALDVASLGPIIIRLGGLQTVRKGLARNIARRIAAEAAKGAGREGITEAIQETIKDATVSLASGKPFFTVETAVGAAESGIAGLMVGGALAGAAGVRGGRPPPSGVRERAAQEAAVRALSPSQDNLTAADRASPIPDDVISEGRAAVQAAEAEQQAAIPEGAVPAEVLFGAPVDPEAVIAEAADLEARAAGLTARQAEGAAALAEVEAGVARLERPAEIPEAPSSVATVQEQIEAEEAGIAAAEAEAAPVTVNPFDQFDTPATPVQPAPAPAQVREPVSGIPRQPPR